MQSSTEPAHVARRIPVGLRIDGRDATEIYCTYKIGSDSVFIDGAPSLMCGQGVELVFDGPNGQQVVVDSIVEGHTGSKLFLRYRNLRHEIRERLDAIVWPAWDGANLLDGLILLAGRHGDASFKDWLRLTNLLGMLQPRLVHRARLDA